MSKKPVHLGWSESGYFMFLEPGIDGRFCTGRESFVDALEEFVGIGLGLEGCEEDARSFNKSDGWRFVVPSEFL